MLVDLALLFPLVRYNSLRWRRERFWRCLGSQQTTNGIVGLSQGQDGSPNPTVYWPIAVWSILATWGEGRLSLMPARPKAASSGDTRRSSMMATSAP